MSNELLTPLQVEFLQHFFQAEIGQSFFLTGGTALAAFHLHHRRSDDLDLFTLDDLALQEADVLIQQIVMDITCSIGRARRTEHFRQFLLEPEDPNAGPPLQVDLVREYGPQFGNREVRAGIIVDSIENIGANKITAILGRTEAKDFVDLYFILQAGYDFDDLFAKAQHKDGGLHPFHFAGTLRQVQRVQRLPAMRKPLELDELRAYFLALADRLIDQLEPDE